MKKEIEEKLRKAKKGLIDAADIVVPRSLAKDIYLAIEAIDDALEGKIRFPKR